MNDALPDLVDEAVDAIRSRSSLKPRAAVILGSGLGGLARNINDAERINFGDLPHFPPVTATGHRGRLVLGHLVGVPVVLLQGRYHLYEGYTAQQASFPVRVLHRLGAEVLVVTNAAGGVNPRYRVGEVMAILDHINWMFRSPTPGQERTGGAPRAPRTVAQYDRNLAEVVLAASRRHNFICHAGTYVGMLGPTYETRAEYRMVRRLGGDVVGMSTIPEVVVAGELGMRVAGISTVTNSCSPDHLLPTSGHQVVAAARGAGSRVQLAIEEILRHLG